MYYYVSWSSTTPTSCSIYSDSTYTTTPGDLGTSTTLSINIDIDVNGSLPANGDFQFWTSDTSDGVLMTQNRTALFWDPGVAEGMFYPDDSWDGTVNNKASSYFPWTNHDPMMINAGAYPINSTLSSTDYNMNILVGHNVSSGRPDGYGEMIAAPPISWGKQTTNYYPGVSDTFAFFLPQDSIYYYPTSSSATNRQWGTTSAGSMNVIFNSDNSKYYMTTSSTGMGVDCGTTEPLLT